LVNRKDSNINFWEERMYQPPRETIGVQWDFDTTGVVNTGMFSKPYSYFSRLIVLVL